MQEIRRDFGRNACKIMIAIRNCNEKELCVTKLAKSIGYSIYHPDFHNVFNYLKEVGAIIYTNKIGLNKMIKINKKMIRDIIDEQPETNYWYDYFYDAHFIEW